VLRGVRGAITVDNNTQEDILKAAEELLSAVITANNIKKEDTAAIIFTVTPDLNKAFPAKAARMCGFKTVPLLDMLQPDVEGALQKCIRILLLWNTHKDQEEIKHIYLKGAKKLRPDILEGNNDV